MGFNLILLPVKFSPINYESRRREHIGVSILASVAAAGTAGPATPTPASLTARRLRRRATLLDASWSTHGAQLSPSDSVPSYP